MKKGCVIVLIVLAVLLVLLAVGVFVAYRVADERLGLSPAPPISHEQAVKGDARIRLVISPEKLAPFIPAYLPSEMQVQGLNLNTILDAVLPREVAVLAHSDVIGKKLALTFFANEKRLGLYIQNVVNASDFFSSLSQVTWVTDGFELPERGFLVAEGNLAIPDTVQETLFELWPTATTEPAATIKGMNQAELIIDNRNGDILAVAAAIAQANGQDWETLKDSQYGETVIGIMESIYVGRLEANLLDSDTADIALRIDSDEEKGPGLQFLLSGLALPYLRDYIKEQYGLILEGELPWNAEENAIIGSFKLTGLEAFIKSRLAQAG